jgi:hypothetical protein
MTKHPLFRQRKGSIGTQELIFHVLTKRYPLSIAKIHLSLLRDAKTKLSFQAVSKCVSQMLKEGTLEKVADGYQLSLEWLLNARSAIDKALSRYRTTGALSLESDEAFQRFTVSSLYEADTLWGDILFNLCKALPPRERSKVVSLNHYCWWLPLNLGREQELFENIQKLGFKVSFLFSTRVPTSKEAAQFYRDNGIEVFIGKNLPIEKESYYNVINDRIIRIDIPQKLHEKIKELFSKAYSINAITPSQIASLGNSKAEITITVFRNVMISHAIEDLNK